MSKKNQGAVVADRGYSTDEEYVAMDDRAKRMRQHQRYSKNDERLGSDHAREMSRMEDRFPGYLDY
jgi:hypothetical protein